MKMTVIPISVTIVLIVAGLHNIVSSSDVWKSSLEVVRMDEICKMANPTFALDTNRLAAVIKFDSENMRYPNCSLGVYSAYEPAKRVKFTIHDYNLRESGCLTVDQFEPNSRVSFILPIFNHPRVVCYEKIFGKHVYGLDYEGQTADNGSWTSENYGLLIRHVQKYPVDRPHTFTIFVNVVRNPNSTRGDPYCTSEEIKCGNSLCIPRSISCLGINPCGDQTDCIPELEEEDKEPHWLAILGYIGLAIFAVFLLCFCCKRCIRSSSSDLNSDSEVRRNRSGSSIEAEEEERVPLENQISNIPAQDVPPPYIPPDMTYTTIGNTSGLPDDTRILTDTETQPPSYREVMTNEDKYVLKE